VTTARSKILIKAAMDCPVGDAITFG